MASVLKSLVDKSSQSEIIQEAKQQFSAHTVDQLLKFIELAQGFVCKFKFEAECTYRDYNNWCDKQIGLDW